MKPLFIRLKGFRGILAGLGAEEIKLDLTKLDGLVAITGPNGSGKTTLCDNLHPYRIMPYKLRGAKNWSPGAFNYYDQCYGRDAVKELYWQLDGVTYRSLILIDAEKRKQEAYLYAHVGEPYVHGEDFDMWDALNDGKTATYDEAVEKLLGSPSLFFTSVFRAQGAKNLSEYTRGDILGIIGELLNLDGIREQGEKAREVGKLLSARRDQERAVMQALTTDAFRAAEVNDKIHALRGELKTAEDERYLASEDLAEADEALRKLSLAKAMEEGQRQALAKLNSERQEALAEESRLQSAVVALREERKRLTDSHARKIADLHKKKERAEGMQAHAEEIRASVAKEADAKDRLQVTRDRLEQLRGDAEGLRQEEQSQRTLERKEATLRAEMGNLEAAMKAKCDRLRHQLETAEKAAGKLSDAACTKRGETLGECPFIQDAVAAQGLLDGLRESLRNAELVTPEMEGMEHRIDATRTDLKRFTDLPQRVEANQRDFTSLHAKAQEIEKELAEFARWTRLVPELDFAIQTISEVNTAIAAENEEDLANTARLDTQIAQSEDAVGGAARKTMVKTRVIAELEKAINPNIDAEIRTAEARKATVQAMVADAESRVRRFSAAIAAEERTYETLALAQARVDTLRLKLERFDAEIAKWKLVEKGVLGVIPLEIDDAGPGIAAQANDLLAACYGSRFSVRIETQSEKRDGTAKEDFDITVFDSETGSATSIREKSGGQTIWIEDAITRAICLYQIGGSGHTFHALFSDEHDGALDADRKQEFMAVKRRAMELGAHAQEFFITQTPELVSLADARVVVGNGQVQVEN